MDFSGPQRKEVPVPASGYPPRPGEAVEDFKKKAIFAKFYFRELFITH